MNKKEELYAFQKTALDSILPILLLELVVLFIIWN